MERPVVVETVVDLDFETTWNALIRRLSESPYRVAALEKASRFVRVDLERSSDLAAAFNKPARFVDCGKTMCELGFTSPDHLYAMGGSAGGWLMGAVINMAPELFNGVIAAVPFVDVINTMLDETIPLTTGEFDEWGNPKNKDSFDYMMSYSPYDNVTAQDYPHMLVTTGYWDSQVQYWEPAKWVAKLRDVKTDDNLLIMDCNMETGHGGASGRFKRLRETAMEYAFFMMLEGINE